MIDAAIGLLMAALWACAGYWIGRREGVRLARYLGFIA